MAHDVATHKQMMPLIQQGLQSISIVHVSEVHTHSKPNAVHIQTQD